MLASSISIENRRESSKFGNVSKNNSERLKKLTDDATIFDDFSGLDP